MRQTLFDDMKILDALIEYVRCNNIRKVYKLFINSQNVYKGRGKIVEVISKVNDMVTCEMFY